MTLESTNKPKKECKMMGFSMALKVVFLVHSSYLFLILLSLAQDLDKI
jgi:hypothetical protein